MPGHFSSGHFRAGHFRASHFGGTVGIIIEVIAEKFQGFIANIGRMGKR